MPLDSLLEPAAAPPPFAGRYQLGRVLGFGGQAVVHEAVDTVTSSLVAVKLYRGARLHQDAIRREIAVLRWLRLPGIVQLLDAGEAKAGSYVVMERVQGVPFLEFDPTRLARWEEIREPLLALLGVLGWVHAAGLLHRDLKPANVMLRADGSPVLLDFGTVQDTTLPDETTRGWATEAYAPPEQLATGRCDARTDLYALGVMLYSALSGELVRSTPVALLRKGALPPPATPIRAHVPELPAMVAEMIDRMVAPLPDDRPASAAEVAHAFREGAPPWQPAGRPTMPVAGPGPLLPIFAGHTRFHHLPEDAAALLFEASGGAPAAIEELLRAWLDTGWVRRHGEQLVTDRASLERIRCLRVLTEAQPGGRPFAPSALPATLAEQCLDLGRRLRAEGRASSAASLFALGLGAARRAGEPTLEHRLAVALADAALVQELPGAADTAVAELERAPVLAASLRPLAALLRAAVETRGPFPDVLAALDQLPAFPDEALEIWRQGLRATTARRIDSAMAEEVLSGMEAWSTVSPLRRAKLDGWWGNLRYRQCRFDEAAALHLRSAAGKRVEDGLLSALHNASQALLDAGRLVQAEQVAIRVVEVAQTVRQAEFEARGALLLRNIQYRRGLPLVCDAAVVAAAAPLGPYVEGAFALVEAGIAWRSGDLELARELADHASTRFPTGPVPEAALLSRALGWLCSSRSTADAAELVAEARSCRLVGLAAQVRGLLSMGGVVAVELDEACHRWLAQRGAMPRSMRAELLAPDECVRGVA